MKAFRFIFPVLAMLAWFPLQMNAQVEEVPETADSTSVVPEGYELVDSVIFVPASRVDSALVGRNIFDMMPSKSAGDAADVNIYQSPAIVSVMDKSFGTNAYRPYTGYRVRIFFDNRQSARQDSEDMVRTFEKMYPGVPAYRSYVNPYFKITVGDFRTKSEAMRFLNEIVGVFPKSFIVKENIGYPVIDKDSLYTIDTVQILRKLDVMEEPDTL